MKRFIIRSLFYLSPLFVIVIVVYLVDPYYLFRSNESYNDHKYEIGYSFDQGRRYKIFTYWNNPTDKIILGASEINIINERNIPDEGWHSLSYGGAPLQESLRMYWEVCKTHKLTKVLIAPEFIKYYNAISSANGDPYYTNFSWETSQSAKALDIYDNKLDYFIDKYTLKSTWYYLVDRFCTQTTRNKPSGTKDDFWNHQIKYARGVYGENIIFPERKQEILSLFRSIKEDAKSKGVEVMIVIPIQHIDLLKEEYKKDVYNVYIEYLSSLVEIFDGIYYLAYTEGVSDNIDYFSDPFHCTIVEPYIEVLFGEKQRFFTKETILPELEIIRTKLYQYE